MTVRRLAAAAAAAGIAGAVGMWPTAAQAHGAPVSPVSRASVCAAGGAGAKSAACVAALAANGGPFGSFDNLRVPGVNGDDQQFIPDGQLCSASLPEFRGLDVARADWPTTKVTAGTSMAMQYRATIPHEGSFRVYLTKAGYDPAQPLRWKDLGATPIVTVTNPPLTGGSYRMTAKLPPGLTGTHVLYTVWQTSSTPDTYYSCSDLLLTPAGAAAAGARPGAPAASGPAQASAAPGTGTVAKPLVSIAPPSPAVPPTVAAAPPETGRRAARESWLGRPQPIFDDRIALGQQLLSAALVVLVGITGGIAFMRIRAARAAHGVHRRAEKR
jgi:predicted carbohydrate-binding protein with CBM5 and CBM33 domain